MLCPYCINGFVYKKVTVEEPICEDISVIDTYDIQVPCDECLGYKILNCCEGLICND